MSGRTFLLIVAALLAGGGSAGAQGFHRRHRDAAATTKPAAPEKAFPFDVTWVLQSINDKPLISGDAPSFAIDQTLRARGFAGCNTFSMAYYPVKNQTLASGAIAMTRKTCPPETAALERTVLVAMHSQPKWIVRADGDLILTAGRTALRFRRGI